MINKLINNSNKVFRIDDLKDLQLDNLKLDNGYLVLVDKNKDGVVTSYEYNTALFGEIIGCFCALTPNNSTVNLEISIKVNNEWSKYFSYGDWCLGGSNLYYNQDDKLVEMNVDEILPKDGLKGNAFKFRVTLKNEAKLFMVVISYEVEKYSLEYNKELLNKDCKVLHNVPKLNQNMVPEIGHEMCSATTTAMLLKYKGEDFSKYDSEFEHRYVANLVADRGHNSPTFGNWVYNTLVMGAYNYNGYTFRVNNFEELKFLLDNVGPVGASIRGDCGIYKTGGHLLVAIGYKVENGKAYVLCNDPNVNERFGEGLFVYYEYPIEVFNAFFRGMCYVIE